MTDPRLPDGCKHEPGCSPKEVKRDGLLEKLRDALSKLGELEIILVAATQIDVSDAIGNALVDYARYMATETIEDLIDDAERIAK